MSERGLDWLFAHCTPEPNSGCWLWDMAVSPKGYGYFMQSKKRVMAHRHALALRLGSALPPGMCACHRCDTPGCINPDHLFLGTPGENSRDRHRKGRTHRWIGGRPSTINPHRKLSEDDVRIVRRWLLENVKQKEIARRMRVTRGAISHISMGITWRGVV